MGDDGATGHIALYAKAISGSKERSPALDLEDVRGAKAPHAHGWPLDRLTEEITTELAVDVVEGD
jgi:hypothetical protein